MNIYEALDGAMESALSDRGDTEFDMDAVVTAVVAAGVPAYVEQTGGGVATIYAGEPLPGPDGPQPPILAGPGWFDGPGFTQPRATTAEFYIGHEDADDPNGYMTLANEFDEGNDTDLVTVVTGLIVEAVKRATT